MVGSRYFIGGLQSTIFSVFFALITQPLLYIQTAEAVRNNRFGPPRHDEPDFNSPDYRRARSFFRSNRANASNPMAIEPPNQNNDEMILIGGPPRHLHDIWNSP